jgi:hypothetical protein
MPVLCRRANAVHFSESAEARLRELHRDVLSIPEFRKLMAVPLWEFQPAPRADDADEGWFDREAGLLWRIAISRSERDILGRREDWQEPPDAMAYDYRFIYRYRPTWAPTQRAGAYTVLAILSNNELAGEFARYFRSLRPIPV